MPPPEPTPELFLRESVVRQDMVVRCDWMDGSVTRLATTIGGLRLPADAVETVDGAYYACAPFLLELPPFRSLVNGAADIVGLKLSGVPDSIAPLAADNAHLAEGALISVGKVFFDADWQIVGAARWGFTGQGGELAIERKAGRASTEGDISPMERSIQLSVSSQMILRAGSYRGYWTDPNQKVEHPTDEIFSQLNKISVGYNKSWPRF
jgi:hypothetical protein